MSHSHLQPPFVGIADTLYDALILLEAAKRGMIPRITRRLFEAEREVLIKSGSIFIFDTGETNITRWTDGRQWSASRMKDNFLIYRETTKGAKARKEVDPAAMARRDLTGDAALKAQEEIKRWVGSIQSDTVYRDEELVKKTITIQIGDFTQHFISYFSLADALSGRLRQPSTIPELAALEISPEYLIPEKPYRNPLVIHYGPDGVPRYGGEGDYASLSPRSRPLAIPSVKAPAINEPDGEGSDSGSSHSHPFPASHSMSPALGGGHSTSSQGNYFPVPSGLAAGGTVGQQLPSVWQSHPSAEQPVYLPPLPPIDHNQFHNQPHDSQSVFLPPPNLHYQHSPHHHNGYYQSPQDEYRPFPHQSPQWQHQRSPAEQTSQSTFPSSR